MKISGSIPQSFCDLRSLSSSSCEVSPLILFCIPCICSHAVVQLDDSAYSCPLPNCSATLTACGVTACGVSPTTSAQTCDPKTFIADLDFHGDGQGLTHAASASPGDCCTQCGELEATTGYVAAAMQALSAICVLQVRSATIGVWLLVPVGSSTMPGAQGS